MKSDTKKDSNIPFNPHLNIDHSRITSGNFLAQLVVYFNSQSIMSLLAPEIHANLSQLLVALTSSENDIRSRAEEQLNQEWVAGRPDVLLMGLVEQLQASQDVGVSQVRRRWMRSCLFLSYDQGINMI